MYNDEDEDEPKKKKIQDISPKERLRNTLPKEVQPYVLDRPSFGPIDLEANENEDFALAEMQLTAPKTDGNFAPGGMAQNVGDFQIRTRERTGAMELPRPPMAIPKHTPASTAAAKSNPPPPPPRAVNKSPPLSLAAQAEISFSNSSLPPPPPRKVIRSSAKAAAISNLSAAGTGDDFENAEADRDAHLLREQSRQNKSPNFGKGSTDQSRLTFS
jgi:hypothetical protein